MVAFVHREFSLALDRGVVLPYSDVQAISHGAVVDGRLVIRRGIRAIDRPFYFTLVQRKHCLMRISLTLSLLLGLLAGWSTAQYPAAGTAEFKTPELTTRQVAESDGKGESKRLHARIVELEKRISRLEAMLRRPSPETPPSYLPKPNLPPSNPTPVFPPQAFPPPIAQGVPPRTPIPHPNQTPQYAPPQLPPLRSKPTPVPPPHEQVPKSWQRFEFNGRSFYIVPTDQLMPDNRSRR